MIWILLLIGPTFSVCGMFAVKKPPTLYQAEEDDDVTIGWDVHTKTDMPLRLICVLRSEPLKVFYEMVNSVDVPESSHHQFAGRVQCDKDALREGRLRLHVSGVKTEDSGQYWCDLTSHHDKITRGLELQPTEHFVLNVTLTDHGENSEVSLNPPKPKLSAPKGAERASGSRHEEIVAPIALVAVIVGALVWANWTSLAACVCGDKDEKIEAGMDFYVEVPMKLNKKQELITK